MKKCSDEFLYYLRYNCLTDYLSVSRPNVPVSVVTAIKSRHARHFINWQQIIKEAWILNYYGPQLPSELLSGHIPADTFKITAMAQVLNVFPYENKEASILAMQYPTDFVPVHVYNQSTSQILFEYETKLTKSGLNKENIKKAMEHKTKEIMFTAKMEAVGVKEKQAKEIIIKSSAIDLTEQYIALLTKTCNAKTMEERKNYTEQLKAFVQAHKEFLEQNKKVINNLIKQINQETKNNGNENGNGNGNENGNGNGNGNDNENGNGNQNHEYLTPNIIKTPKPIEDEKLEEKSTPKTEQKPQYIAQDVIKTPELTTPVVKKNQPPKETPSSQVTEADDETIYDYLSRRMDNYVYGSLKTFDRKMSQIKHQPPTSDGLTPAQEKGAPATLKEAVSPPSDINSWLDDYLHSRITRDPQYAARMQMGLFNLQKAVHDERSIDDLVASFQQQSTKLFTHRQFPQTR